MSLGHRHRKWGKGRSRNRPKPSSLTQQTHKNRRASHSITGSHQWSNSRWSDSRRSSDESFACMGVPMGETCPSHFELKPAPPKRNPKLRQTNHQPQGDTPAAMELDRAAEADTQSEIASMMERIRLLKLFAEMEKGFPSPSADLDHPTYLDGLIAKDGESPKGSESVPGAFISPLPYHDSTNCETNVVGACKLHEVPKSTFGETGQLHFNVDIFKKPGSDTFGKAEAPSSNQNSGDVLEELHAERWEYLQQLERRATEASLEGLRKASLKADTERSQSISSSGHNTSSSSGSRKFSFSRQRRVGSDRSQRSSSIRNRFGSNDSNKAEPIGSNAKLNPVITLTHPPETYAISKKDKLLLRSPSVTVMPVLQEISSPTMSRDSSHRPLGPRPMSKISDLSNISDSSNQGNEKEILIPLVSHFNSAMNIDPKETEVISIPTSAIKQMVRTSKYLINRKNSTNYPSPFSSNFNNWNYQDQLNADQSTDDLPQPSLIEITLNEVDTEIDNPAADEAEVLSAAKAKDEETSEVKDPEGTLNVGTENLVLSDGSVESHRSPNTNGFRRLSIGDGRAVPRNKRYKYMKTHPPLPPYGPSPVLPQLNPKSTEPRQETKTYPRVRSASLGAVDSAHKRKNSAAPISPSKIKPPPSSAPPKALYEKENCAVDPVSNYKNHKQTNFEPWGYFRNSGSVESLAQHNKVPASSSIHKKRSTSRRDDSASLNQSDKSTKKIYKFTGKSQSEPSLRFLSSSSLHRFGSQYNHHRKLRKRSHVFNQKNPPAVPPLPAIFLTESHPHSQPHHPQSDPLPLPLPHSQTKQKSFLLNLKLFWKSFLAHNTRDNPLIMSATNTKPEKEKLG